MLKHWRTDAIIALRVTAIVTVLVYGPILFYEGLVQSIYVDHETLVRDSAKLKEETSKLSADLEDRKRNLYQRDPVFDHVRTIFESFKALRHDIGDKTPCEIEITAPLESGTSGPIISQFSELGGMASNCGMYGPMDSNLDPNVEREATAGMIPGVIIVHTKSGLAGSLAFYGSLGSIVSLKRSFEMPKNKPQTLLWLQFGKDVKWTR